MKINEIKRPERKSRFFDRLGIFVAQRDRREVHDVFDEYWRVFSKWVNQSYLTYATSPATGVSAEKAKQLLTGAKILKRWPKWAPILKEIGITDLNLGITEPQAEEIVFTLSVKTVTNDLDDAETPATPVPTPPATPTPKSPVTNLTPTSFDELLSFIQKRMDPNQAKLMLSKVQTLSESRLMERGEYRTKKLIALYRTLNSKQKNEIKAALQKVSTRVKSKTPTKPPAEPPVETPTKPPAEPPVETPTKPPAEPPTELPSKRAEDKKEGLLDRFQKWLQRDKSKTPSKRAEDAVEYEKEELNKEKRRMLHDMKNFAKQNNHYLTEFPEIAKELDNLYKQLESYDGTTVHPIVFGKFLIDNRSDFDYIKGDLRDALFAKYSKD